MRLRMALVCGLLLACLGCPHHPSSPDAGSGTTSGGGGSDGGTSGTPYSGDFASWCQALGQTFCDAFSRCQALYSAADCTKQFDCGSAGEEIAAGFERFDATAAQQCLDGLRTAPCNDEITGYLFFCVLGAIRPNVAEGGACVNSYECIDRPDGGGLVCQTADGANCGTCTAGRPAGSGTAQIGQPCDTPPDYLSCAQGYCAFGNLPDGGFGSTVCTAYVPEGGDCSGSTARCDPNADFCKYDQGTQTCAPRLGPGGTCSFSDECQPDLYCLQPADGGFMSAGTCVQRIAAGGACDPNGVDGCAQDTRCVQGICKPYSAGIGQPCDHDTWCKGGTCSNPDGGSGTCVSYSSTSADAGFGGTLHDPCDASRRCSSLYRCVNGTCAPLPSLGEPCARSNDFSSGECLVGLSCSADAGICERTPLPGDVCQPDLSCEGGFCDPSTSACKAYLAPGSPCDPALFECDSRQRCSSYSDGGETCVDAACVTPDGGSPYCRTYTCH